MAEGIDFKTAAGGMQRIARATDDEVTTRLSAVIGAAICQAITTDDAIDVQVILSALQTEGSVVGQRRAKECFAIAWTTHGECVEEAIREATKEMKGAGAFDGVFDGMVPF